MSEQPMKNCGVALVFVDKERKPIILKNGLDQKKAEKEARDFVDSITTKGRFVNIADVLYINRDLIDSVQVFANNPEDQAEEGTDFEIESDK